MNIYKGIAAGVAGGLAGSLAMNQFQALWAKFTNHEERPHGAQAPQQGSPTHGIGRELAERGVDDPDDDATERTGNAVSELVLHHHLTKSEKETAGVLAHYAMGAGSGAVYGAVTEMMPGATVAQGLPFGVAVWLIADEGIVPAVGLSRKPTDYPASIHAFAFAAHLVYGFTTEVVRRAVRRAL
ncbi:MAG: DUF1440 domain-containing protein [Acidobacteria bacterium]|nr:DUF1440 domain-containing protein [Acidobacteriota bacterium]